MVCLAPIFCLEILSAVLLRSLLLLVKAISLSTACLVLIAFVEILLVVLASSLSLLIEAISLAEFGLFLTAYLTQIFSIFYRF